MRVIWKDTPSESSDQILLTEHVLGRRSDLSDSICSEGQRQLLVRGSSLAPRIIRNEVGEPIEEATQPPKGVTQPPKGVTQPHTKATQCF